MSFVDKDIAELVCSAPDELLVENGNAPSARDRLAMQSWRRYNRLQEQEKLLATKLNRNNTGNDQLQPQIQRRAPGSVDKIRRQAKITIPKIFECFAKTAAGEDAASSVAYSADKITVAPPESLGLPTPASSRPTSAATGRLRPSSVQPRQRPLSAKSFHTVTSTGSVGPSTSNPITHRQKEELWSDNDDDASVEKLDSPQSIKQQIQSASRAMTRVSLSGKGTNPRSKSYTAASSLSPVERIGNMYSPSARVRTRFQNANMNQFTKPSETIKSEEHHLIEEANYRGVLGADPALSRFLSLDEYDTSEYDMSSIHDEIKNRKNTNKDGLPAKSMYFHRGSTVSDGKYAWETCSVTDYDPSEHLYEIQWDDSVLAAANSKLKTKWVKPLNLIINACEDEESWESKLESARLLRDAAERSLREQMYINDLPDDMIPTMSEQQVDRILLLVAPEFPRKQLYIIEKGLVEMKTMYTRASKEAVYRYKMIHPSERERVKDLHLPEHKPPPHHSGIDMLHLRGTIEVPCEPGTTNIEKFNKNRQFIADNLFSTHFILRHTIHKLVGKWSNFEGTPLFDSEMTEIKQPCEIWKFRDHQLDYISKVTNRLKKEWTTSAVTVIQNDLIGNYSFYDDDIQKYNKGRMKRFLRVVHMIMGHQLREMVNEAVRDYADFLQPYKVVERRAVTKSSFNFGDPSECLSKKQFLDLVGAKHVKNRPSGPPALRAEFEPDNDPAEVRRRKTIEEQNIRVSLGYAPDDKSAPRPGTLEFIRRKASHVSSTGTLDNKSLQGTLSPGEPMMSQPDENQPEFPSTVASSISGNVSCFKIKLTVSGKNIVFEPSLEEIEEVTRRVLDSLFTTTDDITGVGEQLFPLLQLEPFKLTANTKALRDTDQLLIETKQLVTDVLESNSRGPLQLAELYHDYQYILEINTDDYLQEFLNAPGKAQLADFQNICRRLQDDIDLVAETSLNEVSFPLIKIECYEVKRHIATKAKEIMNAIMQNLKSQCNSAIHHIDTSYTTIFEKVGVKPENPEQLQDWKRYVDSIPKILQVLQVDFDAVTATVQLLSLFGYTPPQESFETYWTTYSKPKRILEELNDSDSRYKENRHRFIQILRDSNEFLLDDLVSIKKRVDTLAYEDDDTKMEELYASVNAIRHKLTDCMTRGEQFNSQEVIFNMPVTKHSLIKEVTQQFEPYEKLWTITHQLSEYYEKWFNGPLLSLVAEEVESKSAAWSRELNRLHRLLSSEAPHVIVRQHREKLDEFRPHIPLVTALLERGLKPRYWEQIGRLVGKEGKNKLYASEELTLTHLLECGLDKYLPEVQILSEAAAKEWRLEDQLEAMKAEWKGKQFELREHHSTRVLTSVDEVQQLIDDHLLKTQTILGSLDVRHIEDVVRSWEKKLQRMRTVIEDWLRCQSMWVYLEQIFNSSDIQKLLPAEATQFERVDTLWKQIMDICLRDPRVEIRCSEERLLHTFEDCNRTLEYVLKQLHKFLETKRISFPRFYFLSNEDLLDILSEAKNPNRIQNHLKKCFEGLCNLHFTEGLDITHMISSEGESIELSKSTNPSDYDFVVEKWLAQVETSMADTVLEQMKDAIKDYTQRNCHTAAENRQQWMLQWPGQIIICVSQIYWARETEEAIAQGLTGLTIHANKERQQLDALVESVRGKLRPVERLTIQSMIVIEVHAMDIIDTELISENVTSASDFTWQAQLRYYYEEIGPGWRKHMGIRVRQTNASFQYGCEYLGNTTRLVITPLTDRCYRTLMGAVHLSYGGAPEGPAGTGKTETVKDLAKAVAKYCLVYNCSDQISHVEMAKMFRGLTASGSWACFDEFNRIETQVLSVIAQQIMTIQEAIIQDRIEFDFEGQFNALKPGCAVFITMNPGYAGRAELPDNLKALFRPAAMMIPDYAMIGEISLFSFGFKEGRELATKIVATYRLCSEQLSTQHHYDYGMRAVKTVLIAAGNIRERQASKRGNAMSEKQIVLRALFEVNLPKFLPEDLELFKLITRDLFPNETLPDIRDDGMSQQLPEACDQLGCQATPFFIQKVNEVYSTLGVRHGMMLIGRSFGGKSTSLSVLSKAFELRETGETINQCFINPKAITTGQLYGTMDAAQEWIDGVLSSKFRQASVNENTNTRHWIVVDGPVDALWIESMNTLLDDNKKLCLLNGDIVHMNSRMSLIFEVDNVNVASPATVSRCGMVHFDPDLLHYRSLIESWYKILPSAMVDQNENPPSPTTDDLSSFNLLQHIKSLVEFFIRPALDNVQRGPKVFYTSGVEVSVISVVNSFLAVYLRFLKESFSVEPSSGSPHPRDKIQWVEGFFIQSIVWTFSGWLSDVGRVEFCNWFSQKLRQKKGTATQRNTQKKSSEQLFELQINIPEGCLLDFAYTVSTETGVGQWTEWVQTEPLHYIPEDSNYNDIIIPTKDTIRHSAILRSLLSGGIPVLFSGHTGTGKSTLIKSVIDKLSQYGAATTDYTAIYYQFSARTTSGQTQQVIESHLERRRRAVLGPSQGKRCLLFIDDFSMPDVEVSGAQPALELLRQFFDYGGWYGPHKSNPLTFTSIKDVIVVGALQPNLNTVSQRVLRHFITFCIPQFDGKTLTSVFTSLLEWVCSRNSFPAAFTDALQSQLVSVSVFLFNEIKTNLRPTPSKPQYNFNLRDLSRVFQGMHQCPGTSLEDVSSVYRLWVYEIRRVFSDRLTDSSDEQTFNALLDKGLNKNGTDLESLDIVEPLIFSDINNEKVYQEVKDTKLARETLERYQNELNDSLPIGETRLTLVIFNKVLEHVTRLYRILRVPRGHALVIGIGGSGRQSAAKLANYIAEYNLYQLKPQKGYSHEQWQDDLRNCIRGASGSINASPTTLLLTDETILNDVFLQDIACLLNTGEVPSLFEDDDLIVILEGYAKIAKELGRREITTKEGYYRLFVQHTKSELHIVVCLSPVGGALRKRLRLFPSLVSCCSIDYVGQWPEEGLVSVGNRLVNLDHDDNIDKESIIDTFVKIHQTALEVSAAYQKETSHVVHITATSYLDLVAAFKRIYEHKTTKAKKLKSRYEKGLRQLIKTEESVGTMQRQLEVQRPRLAIMAEHTAQLILSIEKDERDAAITSEAVAVEERAANEKAEESKTIKEQCEAVLARVMPALDVAMQQVSEIDKRQLVEIRTMTNPSEKIKQVMAAVCVCLGVKPGLEPDPSNPKKKRPDYWIAAKRLMSDSNEFLVTLLSYKDREEGLDPAIFDSQNGTIQPFINDKNFIPDKVRSLSRALAPVCAWVIAMERFYQVELRVKPRKAELQRAQAEYDVAMGHLALKKAELDRVDQRLREMREKLAESVAEKERVEAEYSNTEHKLSRAQKIISGLGDEKDRYMKEAEKQAEILHNAIGDSLLSAAHFSHLSAFTQKYRKQLLECWRMEMTSISSSTNFELNSSMGDDAVIEEWKLQGLPSDSFSVDNAVIIDYSSHWVMILDPHQQATTWLKARYASSNLMILQPNQEGYLKSIAMAVRTGTPILLEDCGDELDPVLNSLLMKHTTPDSTNQRRITIGDQDVVYHSNWLNGTAKLFLATRRRIISFSPETASKVTIVAFTVTPAGLQDQILGKIIQFEERELDEKKNRNVRLGATNKRELKRMENKILELLGDEGCILDNEETIDALNEAQRVAEETTSSQREVERILSLCDRTRKRFIDVAENTTALFFCASELGALDPMYQYSLRWFLVLFSKSLELSKMPADTTSQIGRNGEIAQHFYLSFYRTICGSIFAKDQPMLAFNMACVLSPEITTDMVRYFCTLGTTTQQVTDDSLTKPDWLPEHTWKLAVALSAEAPFKNLATQLSESTVEDQSPSWHTWWCSDTPAAAVLPGNWDNTLRWEKIHAYHRLLLVRALRPDRVVAACSLFIEKHPLLGPNYTSPQVSSLTQVFHEVSDPSQPLIFILSAGADPMVELRKLADEEDKLQKMHTLSLGQGMQGRAERLLQDGRANGWWVVLQNCHLYSDWMPHLERIVEEYSVGAKAASLHEDFRLWLTSMPSTSFPTSILMHGTKVICESANGLRVSLLSSYTSVPLADPAFYEIAPEKALYWRKLCYSLCFFHAIVQERKSFGPLGWNIPYEFNSADLTISLKQLKCFIEDYEEVPYDALTYLAGECNYGGRVTDDRDRRCLIATLNAYYNDVVMTPGYSFDIGNSVFAVPEIKQSTDMISHIAELPTVTPPSVFGLHSNAVATKDEREGRLLLDSLLTTQPRVATVDQGGSSVTSELLNSLIEQMPVKHDTLRARIRHPISYSSSMNTVLLMELSRYNNLLHVIRDSVLKLKAALSGEAVLTSDLEVMYSEVQNGKLPSKWAAASYPSCKPMLGYFKDFVDRMNFISSWDANGSPASIWLSGIFFTQALLTGVLQDYCRREKLEIDTLEWSFSFKRITPEEVTEPPSQGCYVHGLFIQGASWNSESNRIQEPHHNLIYSDFPVTHLTPIAKQPDDDSDEAGVEGVFVKCPLYRTSERRGTLRFVITIFFFFFFF